MGMDRPSWMYEDLPHRDVYGQQLLLFGLSAWVLLLSIAFEPITTIQK